MVCILVSVDKTIQNTFLRYHVEDIIVAHEIFSGLTVITDLLIWFILVHSETNNPFCYLTFCKCTLITVSPEMGVYSHVT